MSSQVDDDLKRKIRDLFDLADDTDNPNEAATATKKAQRLLERHNLSMVDVEQSAEDLAGDVSIEEQDISYAEAPYMPLKKWKEKLAAVVAQFYDCRVIITNRKTDVRFIGPADNVQTSVSTFKFLRDQLNVLCEKASADSDRVSNGEIDPIKFRESFFYGAVRKVDTRLHEIKRTREDGGANEDIEDREEKSNLLARAQDMALEGYIESNYPRLSSMNSNRTRKDHGAVNEGSKAGDEVDLNQGKLNGQKQLEG